MASLVLELQRDALNANMSVSNLLRKALVVARKLGLRDIELWAQNELTGYADIEDTPGYRRISGELNVIHSPHEWQPIHFPDSQTPATAPVKACGQSIPEIETIANVGADGGTLLMNLTPEEETQVRDAVGMNARVGLVVQLSSITKMLDAVRNATLEWSLKLEQDGILGEDLRFTPKEKAIADRASYSVTRFLRPRHTWQIERGTLRLVEANPTGLDLAGLSHFMVHLKGLADGLPVHGAGKEELGAEIKTIEAQLNSPKPKAAILKESLHSIRNILEGIGGIDIVLELLNQLGTFLATSSSTPPSSHHQHRTPVTRPT